jgi:26S proteasome regulatory subunit N7
MAPLYEEICKELKWKVDSAVLSQMQKANEEELKKLDDAVADAEKNLGESDVRDMMMKKAEYLSKIGDKVSISFALVLVRFTSNRSTHRKQNIYQK